MKKEIIEVSGKSNIMQLYSKIVAILDEARQRLSRTVNFAMVQAYWNIGRLIVEDEQGGDKRAQYGKDILDTLSEKLLENFGEGFTSRNLRYMRQFYLSFPIWNAVSSKLNWTQYRHLLKVKDEKARAFYMEECIKSNWSTRQMERQIHTLFYERLLASTDKKTVSDEIQKTEPLPTANPREVIRDPYILEFLGIPKGEHYLESDLEQRLISDMQRFLLELGRGFSFVERQKRITFDDRHFYIDLVFYNYLLRCFVLVELKTGDLTHQDIGQMQMYVNYYTREVMNEGDNPPIGLLLCADKSDAIVRYTLPEDNQQILASKYLTYLPTEAELKAEMRLLHESADREICKLNGIELGGELK